MVELPKKKESKERVDKDMMIKRNHSLVIPYIPLTEITVYPNVS